MEDDRLVAAREALGVGGAVWCEFQHAKSFYGWREGIKGGT